MSLIVSKASNVVASVAQQSRQSSTVLDRVQRMPDGHEFKRIKTTTKLYRSDWTGVQVTVTVAGGPWCQMLLLSRGDAGKTLKWFCLL